MKGKSSDYYYDKAASSGENLTRKISKKSNHIYKLVSNRINQEI